MSEMCVKLQNTCFPEDFATHNPPEIFHFPSNPLCPKHPSSCPLIPKSRSRGKCSLFSPSVGYSLDAVAEPRLLQECPRLFYRDRQSQGQLLGGGLQLFCISLSFLFRLYLCPQFRVLFPSTVEVQTFQLSSSRPCF